MIFSKAAEYAIRACVDMAALEPNVYAMGKDIAERTGAPTPYLLKILQQILKEENLVQKELRPEKKMIFR